MAAEQQTVRCPFCRDELGPDSASALPSHLMDTCLRITRDDEGHHEHRRELVWRHAVHGSALGCPATVLSDAPGGGGLGVWVWVRDEEGGTCLYQYAGGIS
jgi:hypothetical protein